MFKKIILSLSALLLISSNAQASFWEEIIPKNPTYVPYVGVDAGFSIAPFTVFPYNVHVGVDLVAEDSLHFGIEGFYQRYTKGKEDWSYYVHEVTHSVIGLDVISYLPKSEKLKYFAGLGLSYHLFENTYSKNWYPDRSDNKIGFNILGGVQYYVLENVSLRAKAKFLYAHANFDLTIGANYHF